MNTREKSLEFTKENKDRYLDELKEFLEIPSISTSPEHVADLVKAAEWIADKLKVIGMDNVQVMPTERHPMVYADDLSAGASAPTFLIYGHYDVQPADPLDLWESGPFEPVIRGENIYARGASDMKGQVLAAVNAVEAVKKFSGLPLNIKFMLEGEEEIGSPSMVEYLTANKELLKSDMALNLDTGMLSPRHPTLTYALRGMAYFELNIEGANKDLHSGVFGGAVRNAANEIASLISGMHDQNNRITIPGFYDDVVDLTEAERDALNKSPLDADYIKEYAGVETLWGEEGYTATERVGARPTLDCHGILTGFVETGAKTVIPNKAMAKFSSRLVPNQTPMKIQAAFETYIKEHIYPGMKWELTFMSGAKASISEFDSPFAQALVKGLEQAFGTTPIYKREGGSVPVVGYFQDYLGIDSVCSGFGLPDDNLHSPNEKMHLPTWYTGIDALVHMFYNLG